MITARVPRAGASQRAGCQPLGWVPAAGLGRRKNFEALIALVQVIAGRDRGSDRAHAVLLPRSVHPLSEFNKVAQSPGC